MFERIKSRILRFKRFRSEAVYTLNGWRFADLKNYVNSINQVSADVQLGFIVIGNEVRNQMYIGDFEKSKSLGASVALVTCLPPEETGIARFSFEHVINSAKPIHVFSPVRDPAQYLRNSIKISKNSSSECSLHPLSTLLAYSELYEYDKVVFVLGNSNHNIEIYHAMENFCNNGGSAKAVCYLHDPCCHNVVQSGKSLDSSQYRDFLTNLYSDKEIGLGNSGSDSWRIAASAIKANILGPRAIVDMGVGRFLVNSKSAKDIVSEDLRPVDRERVNVVNLFHPVFDLALSASEIEASNDNVDKIIIGTFGLPGASKLTNQIIDAVLELRKENKSYQLIVAGYNAKIFCRSRFDDNIPDWMHVHEPQSEAELQKLMLSCDIAIQLRDSNLGESSGIVPTLLKMGKTIITSPVGSFMAYEGAVVYFDGDHIALAKLISQRPVISSEGIRQFVESHSVGKFADAFFEKLGEL